MNPLLLKFAQLEMQKVLVVGLVLAGLYYITVFDDGSAIEMNIARIEQDIQNELQKKEETNKLLKESEAIKSKLVDAESKFKSISSKISSDLSPTDITKKIQEAVDVSGSKLKQIRPGTVEKKELLQEVPVRLSLIGGYSDFAMFIYHVSKSDIISKVSSFSIKNTISDGSDKSQLEFDGMVLTYQVINEATVK